MTFQDSEAQKYLVHKSMVTEEMAKLHEDSYTAGFLCRNESCLKSSRYQ
jgi:hypothetical protein